MPVTEIHGLDEFVPGEPAIIEDFAVGLEDPVPEPVGIAKLQCGCWTDTVA